MTAPVAPPLSQINLYNASLLPTREIFSARLIVAWVAVAVVLMLAVGWWAILETRSLSREVANTAAYQAAEKARTAPTMIDGEALPTPEQVAARELALRNQQALLEARRAARDVLKRGVADEKGGPSVLMRAIAAAAPPQAWLTEVRVAGGHIDLVGKTLDPVAVTVWLDKLRTSGLLALKPLPAVRVERIDSPQTTPVRPASVYSFAISATLSSPFAEDGGRP
jgi:Tfp pilus assembly protein PilN